MTTTKERLFDLIRQELAKQPFETDHFRQMTSDHDSLARLIAKAWHAYVTIDIAHLQATLTSNYDKPKHVGPNSAVKFRCSFSASIRNERGIWEGFACDVRFPPDQPRMFLMRPSWSTYDPDPINQDSWLFEEHNIRFWGYQFRHATQSWTRKSRPPAKAWPICEKLLEPYRPNSPTLTGQNWIRVPAEQRTKLFNAWLTRYPDSAPFLMEQWSHPHPYVVLFAVNLMKRADPTITMTKLPQGIWKREELVLGREYGRLIAQPLGQRIKDRFLMTEPWDDPIL